MTFNFHKSLCTLTMFCVLSYGSQAQARPAIVTGGAHTIAIDSDGTVWAWGYNGNGQLGDGTVKNSISPVKVMRLTNVKVVAADFSGSMALTDDGIVWQWGGNKKNSTLNRKDLEPHKIKNLPTTRDIDMNQGKALLLSDNDTVWQVKKVNGGRQRTTQVAGLTNIAGITAGDGSFFAYSFDCTLWAWGRNNFGQLGNDSTDDAKDPVQSNIYSCLSSLTASNHVLALSAEGNIWSWGYNREGQLADQAGENRSQPQQISSLSNIIAVASDRHNLALRTDGSVWAWGENNYGQLGNGSTKNSSSPIRIPGLSGVSQISAGAMYSVALKADGSVWAWGRNDYGQLGDGSRDNQLTPVQVIGFDGSGYLNLSPSNTPDIDPVPPVYFTMSPDSGAAPIEISFLPIFTARQPPESVEWDFGDGDISSTSETQHIYTVPGTYIVTLTAYFSNHTTRESMKRVVVKPSWK